MAPFSSSISLSLPLSLSLSPSYSLSNSCFSFAVCPFLYTSFVEFDSPDIPLSLSPSFLCSLFFSAKRLDVFIIHLFSPWSLPDFSQWLPALPTLGRTATVLSPCIGIHGSGHAFKAMNIKSTYRMCYDLEPGYQLYLGNFLMSCGMSFAEVVSNLRLGEKGNINKISFKDIVGPADFLIAGPPCPHWSRGLGCKKTVKDFRRAAFVEVKCAPWHCLSVQQFQYMRSSIMLGI